MSLDLNNEKATGIIIWWIEGSDGAIAPEEEEAIEEKFDEMNYSVEEYRSETKMFISGLSTDRMEEVVDETIQWAAENFSEQRKQQTLELLKTISECDGKKGNEQVKIYRIQEAFNRSS